MSNLTSTERTQVRTVPQRTILHLSIYQPNVILSARTSSSGITKGDRSISYNNATGDYTKIVSGMVCLVGSTPGASDLGRVRVKSATSNTLVVAENSDVRWAYQKYLTVIDLIDITSIFPRIVVPDENNPEAQIWYKDYNVLYSDQHKKLGAFICAGPHRAGMLDPVTNQVQIYYSATGTKHVGDDTMKYYWEFPGADGVTGSTALTPGLITYKTPGHYATKLSVSGTGKGSSDYTYRYTSIYDYDDYPQDWEITGISSSRDGNGTTATVKLNSPWKYGSVYDNAIVVVYADEWYGDTKTNIGGNSYGNENIFFVGYILKGSIQWDYSKSSVTFQVASVTEIMKGVNGFAITLEDEQVATQWYQMPNLNNKKAIWHYLKFHSTVLLTTDLQYKGADRLVQFFDSNRESIFDGVNSFVKSALMGDFTADRQGKLWVETSMEASHNNFTRYPPEYAFKSRDFIDEPSIEEQPIPTTSYIEMGGIVYGGGQSKTSKALLSAAPGITPGNRGKVDSPNGLSLDSQKQLNQMSGDVYAYRNAPLPTISGRLRGAYKFLDVAPLEGQNITISANETVKNISVSGSYFAQELAWDYNAQEQLLLCNATFRQITQGVPGDTVVIPAIPPGDPPIHIPDFPEPKPHDPDPFPKPKPKPDLPLIGNLIMVLFNGRLYYSAIPFGIDADYPAQIWYPSPTGTQQPLTDFEVNAFGQVAAISSSSNGTGTVWYGTYNTELNFMIGPLSLRPMYYDATFNPNSHYQISALGVEYDEPGSFIFGTRYDGITGPPATLALWRLGDTIKLGTATAPLFWNGRFTNGGDDKDWFLSYMYGLGQGARLASFKNDLSVQKQDEALPGGPFFSTILHERNGKNGIFMPVGNFSRIYTNPEIDEYVDTVSIGFSNNRQGFDIDASGQYLMTEQLESGGVHRVYASEDGGLTWTNVLTTGPVTSSPLIRNAGSAYTWVCFYQESSPPVQWKIKLTEDFGATWYDFTGSLGSIIGTNAPTCFRVVVSVV